eukprot:gene6847-11008_t
MNGARNKGTFTQSLSSGSVPHESSISYEGTFSEYYFDDNSQKLQEVCYTTLSAAKTKDTFTGDNEKYISASFHSVFDGMNHREPLNLLVILDISGSMGGRFHNVTDSEYQQQTKMTVANEVLVEILNTLKEDETLGILLFDDKTQVLQSMKNVGNINKDDLSKKILQIKPRGGTHMENGMKTGISMMKDFLEIGKEKNQNNRIIFLTDAMPNGGGGKNSLKSLSEDATVNKIYTTYIGIGLDFNTSLVESLTKVTGANYFSVHSKKEFQKILNEEFNYIVTNIALDCYLLIESEEYEIEEAFGTPFKDETTINTIKIGSQTASDVNKDGTKGGMILIKLRERKLKSKENTSKKVHVHLFYETILGKKMKTSYVIDFEEKSKNSEIYFDNNGIQKLVALTKYVQFSKRILKLKHSSGYKQEEDGKDITTFIKYFQEQMDEIKDKNLEKEIESLNQMKYNSSTSSSGKQRPFRNCDFSEVKFKHNLKGKAKLEFDEPPKKKICMTSKNKMRVDLILRLHRDLFNEKNQVIHRALIMITKMTRFDSIYEELSSSDFFSTFGHLLNHFDPDIQLKTVLCIKALSARKYLLEEMKEAGLTVQLVQMIQNSDPLKNYNVITAAICSLANFASFSDNSKDQLNGIGIYAILIDFLKSNIRLRVCTVRAILSLIYVLLKKYSPVSFPRCILSLLNCRDVEIIFQTLRIIKLVTTSNNKRTQEFICYNGMKFVLSCFSSTPSSQIFSFSFGILSKLMDVKSFNVMMTDRKLSTKFFQLFERENIIAHYDICVLIQRMCKSGNLEMMITKNIFYHLKKLLYVSSGTSVLTIISEILNEFLVIASPDQISYLIDTQIIPKFIKKEIVGTSISKNIESVIHNIRKV